MSISWQSCHRKRENSNLIFPDADRHGVKYLRQDLTFLMFSAFDIYYTLQGWSVKCMCAHNERGSLEFRNVSQHKRFDQWKRHILKAHALKMELQTQVGQTEDYNFCMWAWRVVCHLNGLELRTKDTNYWEMSSQTKCSLFTICFGNNNSLSL